MKKILGFEFGSTRIKCVLIDEKAKVLANGFYDWKNEMIGEHWSYRMEDVISGMQACIKGLKDDYKKKFNEPLTSFDAMGVSAMMHGYIALDEDYNLLVPFRTWRNTTTAKACEILSPLFNFNVPQRWSVAHYYQAVLNNEEHVSKVKHLMTLANYVSYLLTGENVIGIGDASGMFPIRNKKYDEERIGLFNKLLLVHDIHINFEDLLPRIAYAGEKAGTLTASGAYLLDPTGEIKPGCIVCPAEGDAGTGMVATNSVAVKTANISAGTSSFLMLVLHKELKDYYEEIDMVTTPVGDPVAMIHVNNFTNEINEWVNVFYEVATLSGSKIKKGDLTTKLFEESLKSVNNQIVSYNFISGEPIAKVNDGRPLMLRRNDNSLTLANFMEAQINSALVTLSLGMEILDKEAVKINKIYGHGGFFKTPFVGQNAMSAALKKPITIMDNANEGGPWGMAILAMYALDNEMPLADYLNNLFKKCKSNTVMASDEYIEKFENYKKNYLSCIELERKASEVI